jgi:23S rRNA (uracil1939-C5)-methyltransferase
MARALHTRLLHAGAPPPLYGAIVDATLRLLRRVSAHIANTETTTDITIEKLVAGGEGLGFLDGKAVFVPGTLPGEQVTVRLAQRRKDFDRASLISVRQPSHNRQDPPCALAGTCGGCDWLHIRPEEQLAQKSAILRETFRRVGRFSWDEVKVHSGPPLGYRNRVQIHRDPAGRLGFMGAGSARVVPVAECPVSDPAINRIFAQPTLAPGDRDRFTVWGGGGASAVEGMDDERDLEVSVAGRKIAFSVDCFFQSNLAVLEQLVPFVMQDLAGSAAADLYSGVGLFGAFLAERFARVTLVESSSHSMSYARRNVQGDAHELYPLTVEAWTETSAARKPFDAVVADPPRTGLGVEVRRWLCAVRPARLVYVSCNPVTLARDLGELTRGGFTLEAVGLFDFYPQTSHIEAVSRLRRNADEKA